MALGDGLGEEVLTGASWVAEPVGDGVVAGSQPAVGDAAPEASTQPAVREEGSPATQPGATPAPAATSQPVDAPDMPDEAALFDDLDDVALLELELPTVVTAARRPQRMGAVPYAISVITAEDIRRSGARSVPDALRLVPGMDVAELSFGQYAVAPRGAHAFSANKILVLVDGRQIFDAYFGGTIWSAWPMQLGDIERIEVIRGPAGGSWGANAADGVINIITKDPEDQIGLTYHALGGSRGWWRNRLSYAYKEDRLRLRVSGEYEASDGFLRRAGSVGTLRDEQKAGRVSLQGVFAASPDDTLSFGIGNAVMDGGFVPTRLGTLLDGARNSGTEASYVMGKWEHEIAEHNRWELVAYVNDFQLSTGLDAIDYRYQQLSLQFKHAFKPAEAHSLTWGIDTRLDWVDAGGADPYGLRDEHVRSGIVGLYVQDSWNFAPRWLLDLAARIDYDFYGGFEPSWRAALAYDLGDGASVYGAVGRSVAIQSAASRFLDTPLLCGMFHVTADQDIEPQSVVAYEVGYRARFWDRLDSNLVLYWHAYDDLSALPLQPGPPGLVKAVYRTIGSASAYGVEWDGALRVTDEFDVLANYSYQQLEWRHDTMYHLADQILPPQHKAMIGARYSPTDDLHLDSYLYYVDDVHSPDPLNPLITEKLDAYWRLDLRAELELWDDRAAVAVGVKNLLDAHHAEGSSLFLDKGEVGRLIYAELRITFD